MKKPLVIHTTVNIFTKPAKCGSCMVFSVNWLSANVILYLVKDITLRK